MDLGPFVMFNKSINFRRRLNREKFFQTRVFKFGDELVVRKLGKKYNSAQYLKNFV